MFKDPNALAALKVGQSVSVTGLWTESRRAQEYELVVKSDEKIDAKIDTKKGTEKIIDSEKSKEYTESGISTASTKKEPTGTTHPSVSVVGDVPDDYPIQKKATTFQFLRQLPTIRHRTSTLASILRLRSFLEAELMVFFSQAGFTKVAPPMITGADCEGAGEQFQLVGNDFFGKPVGLTVLTQLHLEVLAMSLNRVWTLTPCFRAEMSHTNRHLSEFWMLEAEIAWVDELPQLLSFTESMIKTLARSVKDNADDLTMSRFNKTDIATMHARWDSILTEKWPIITYREALDLINANGGNLTYGDDISTADEKWLAGEHFHSPVFVINYPKDQKPFYMPDNGDGTVACYDLLVPEIGELVGGSLREYRHDILVKEMQDRGMNVTDMEWYLLLRKNGTMPHGGFGLGFERLVAYLSAMDNIKEVIPFPRAPEHCQC